MIKNVVFDYGQVMIKFDPEYMVSKEVSDPGDIALLSSVVFDRLYWDRLDDGTVSDEAVVMAISERLPERLLSVAAKIYYSWIYNIPPIEGMEKLVSDIKATGRKVYLLSNISKYFAKHSDTAPAISLFDGCVFSAVCGFVKPDKAIFEHLCERFDLLPKETVFIDDSIKNVNGAQACGIKAYLFNGCSSDLRKMLERDGVLDLLG